MTPALRRNPTSGARPAAAACPPVARCAGRFARWWAAVGTVALGGALSLPLSAAPAGVAAAEGLGVLVDTVEGPDASWPLPEGVRRLDNLAYGADAHQSLDVYLPPEGLAREAPVIVMVHGGAWMLGDKAARSVVEAKVRRWVPRGVVLVSLDYRRVPRVNPLDQVRDVARAVAVVQARAAEWGASRQRLVLMGHSAGAHLVALLAASPRLVVNEGVAPWAATVLLDSAALDVVQLMERPHPKFYDRVFGRDAELWRAQSPYHQLRQAGEPLLAVCSTRRAEACAQARRFVTGAGARGTRAQVLEQSLSHKELNARLGEEESYTAAVESFLRAGDPAFNRWLGEAPR